ncbi:EAL domain-containing protein [Halomonas pacifica]|uniref:EAL domain-containing protein n=1 Tax=Bisbaumannia pacifica TaxID=77098 RepID=UPI002359078A|nr:EAL domain-containing protein [Halomonas pacifica]MDC8803455.1 EAL domain-containing protein [Halomonas pacifica]
MNDAYQEVAAAEARPDAIDARAAFRRLADSLEAHGDFFDRLSRCLAEILGVDHLLVARIEGDLAHPLSFWSRGEHRHAAPYPLAGTPCASVSDRSLCLFSRGVAARFPDDAQLVELEVESYLGVSMCAPDGRPLGLVAALDSRPLPGSSLVEELLRLAAARAGAELARQLAERQQRISTRRLETLLRHLPSMIYRCHHDPYWTMEYVSQGARGITGYAPEALLGEHARRFAGLIHPADQERLVVSVEEAMAAERPFAVNYRLYTADGELRWVREQGQAVVDESSGLCMIEGVISDISDHKRHERQLEASNRALRLLSRCNAALIHAATETQLLQAVCRLAVEVGGYRFAWVGEARHDGAKSIVPLAQAGIGTTYLSQLSLSWSAETPSGRGPAGRALRSGRAEVVSCIDDDPGFVWREAARAHGYHGVVALPLKQEGRPFGLLVLYQGRPQAVSADELRLLGELADNLAYGVTTLRNRREQQQIQQAVLTIAGAVSARGGDEWLDQLARQMAKAVGGQLGFVARLDSDTPGQATTLAAVVDGESLTNFSYLLAGTPCGQVLEAGEVVVHDQAAAALPPAVRDSLGWVRGYAGRRLENAEGRAIGLLGVMFAEPLEEATFVTSLLQIFASRVGAELTRQADEANIRRLAYEDAATGLPNRTAFTERLERALKASRGRPLALLFLDLNRFKEINDTQGHDVGDRVLAGVAERFAAALGEGEFLARLGGDEFVVMVDPADRVAACAAAERLQRALAAPLRILHQAFEVAVSIGIALYPQHAASARELLKHTDIAMYHAKQRGERYCVFEPYLGTRVGERLRMAARLAWALEHDGLSLYFQPQVDLASGRLVGAEALCRWFDDELGAVSPAEFIPLAEERGLIHRLGAWVIDAACRQLAAWRARGVDFPGRLAINVASAQFEDEQLFDELQDALARHGVASECLALELTESGFMHDPDQAVAITQRLKAEGLALHIDDFGTGYSSLAYLKRFDADKIKIDISFVRDMLSDANDHAIVTTIIAMAESLGLSTLAEGVESRDQAEALRALGCPEGQGYFYSPPLPEEAFCRQWLVAE